MIKVPFGPKAIPAFDISYCQPHVNWAAVLRKLVMIKATEGLSVNDPYFKSHWAGATQTAKRKIAYHFYHPSESPEAQAKHFQSMVGLMTPLDGIMLDWEANDNEAAKIDSVHGQETVAAFEELMGKKLFMYGGPYFLEALNLPEEYASRPLVVAEYPNSGEAGILAGPLVPPPWKTPTIWQTTDQASIAGVQGHCDADVFYGDEADLDQLLLSLNNKAS